MTTEKKRRQTYFKSDRIAKHNIVLLSQLDLGVVFPSPRSPIRRHILEIIAAWSKNPIKRAVTAKQNEQQKQHFHYSTAHD